MYSIHGHKYSKLNKDFTFTVHFRREKHPTCGALDIIRLCCHAAAL